MKEIGGYIELETNRGLEYHPDALPLNSCCNCVAYLLKIRKIRKLYLPILMCASVKETCARYQVDYDYYRVGFDFRPILPDTIEKDAWLYIVNYYGQLTDSEICIYKKRFDRVIIDHVQDFYRKPVESVDTVYSCRKFFGVADGAYLYTDCKERLALKTDISYGRMEFLLGRFEKNASEFYSGYVKNNDQIFAEPVKSMSKLTHNLLRGIDYKRTKDRRTLNFTILHEYLFDKNPLSITIPDGAFMYPLYLENGGQIRRILQAEKIYVPILWPDVFEICNHETVEYRMAENILPIPVDQRYDESDMKYIIDILGRILNWKML